MIVRALPYLLVAAVAAGAVWLLKPTPEPVYDRVEVPVEQIVEVERVDTVVTFVERIRYVEAEPEVVAVADSGGVPDLEAFCGPAVAAERERARAQLEAAEMASAELQAPDPVLLLRSVRIESPFLGPDRAIFTGPRSDGSLWQGTYEVRGDWQARARGPEILVQSSRWWWVEDLTKAGLLVGAGYLVGSL